LRCRRAWVALVLVVAVACSRPGSAVAGTYISDRYRSPKDSLELAESGAFTLREDGSTITGTYRMNGERLDFATDDGHPFHCKIEGATLVDAGGARWTREAAAGAAK
jgi:hypothetical protein